MAKNKTSASSTGNNTKFLKDLIKASGSEYATIAVDGGAEVTGWIDTGSASLNALMSGSIRGGYAVPKITGLAGDPSTGKTFFMLEGCRSFLEDKPNGIAIIYDSEHNISKGLLESRGIDPTRVIIVDVDTIEDFKSRAVKMLEHYLTLEESTRPPMFMALDSLGMLSTLKETEDAAEEKHVVDMTKARVTKGTFRILTSLLGKAKVPMIVTNHTYQTIGMFPTKKMGGGCLVAGTKVQTQNGYKNIEDFRIGDTVTTLFSEEEVINTFRHEDKEVYQIEFEDGSIVECSAEHKFLVDGEWIEAHNLAALVKSMETLNTSVDVADMAGDVDVYREQIFQNLLCDSFEGEDAPGAAA